MTARVGLSFMSPILSCSRAMYRFPIRVRVSLMLLVTAGAVLVMGSTYFVGERNLSRTLNAQSQYSMLAGLVQEVEIEALQMRRREKDFILRKDLKYVDRYDTAAGSVDLALAQISQLTVSDSVMENVKRLQDGVALHVRQFHKVVALHNEVGLNENIGLQGEFRRAVHAVERELTAGNFDSLMAKMLMMRRHEKDFMLRGEEKYIELINQRRAEFNVLLADTQMPDATRDELNALMDVYVDGIADYTAAALVLVVETAKLSQIFADMTPDFDRIREIASTGEEQANAQTAATFENTTTVFVIAGVCVLLAAIGLSQIIGMSIADPVSRLTSAMKQLAEGDTSVDIPATEARDEIGVMARAVQVFKDNALERAALMTENDKEQAARAARQKQVDDLIGSFRESVRAVLDTVTSNMGQLGETAKSLSAVATQTTSKAGNASAASGKALSNVQMVAEATEELTASISDISSQISQTKDIVGRARQAATETDAKISNLADAAMKIGEVVSLIQEIAEQTNLLALNATIESARAGEAGKGFAVVASEVKGLATQTAKATEAISGQIADIQRETDSSVKAIREIAETMTEVSSATESIAAAIAEQGTSTSDISNSVQEAAEGSHDVSQNITSVNEVADHTQKSAEEVLAASQNVSTSAESLNGIVDKFLEDVAAA